MSSILSGSLDALVADLYPRYYVQAKRGNLYHATVDTGGVALAVAGTAAGFALTNPAGSKFDVSLVSVQLGAVSGTFVIGTIMHGVNTVVTAAAVTGTAIVIQSGYVGSQAAPVAKAFKTATLPATQTALYPFCIKNATAATSNFYQVQEIIDGKIILAPGTSWSLYIVGADTTPLSIASVTWKELSL